MVFLLLFAAPFVLAGAFAAFLAIHNLANGTLPWPVVVVVGGCALLFAGAGAALAAAGVHGRKRQRAIAEQQAAFADSPWMWRPDWAQGRCDSRRKAEVVASWILALFWNGISLPVIYFTWETLWSKALANNPAPLLALLFPLAGMGIFLGAVRATLRRIEFGKTAFILSQSPGVIGGRLSGNVQARFPHGAARGMRLKLSCVNRVVQGSGRNRSTYEHILWRDEQQLAPENLMPGPEGTMIPVEFRVPADALPCDNSNPSDAIVWVLEADADVPGVDFQDSFEVPVFRTKDSPAVPPVDRRSAFAEVPEGPPQWPAHSKILVQPSSGGGVMFKFPPARNLGAAASTTVFFLVWSAIVAFLWHHAPVIFTIVFGFFDAVLMLIVLSLWLGESMATIEAGAVAVQGGLLGLGRRRVVACSGIEQIRIPIQMQTGGASGTPYYSIELLCRDGRKIIAGQGLCDKLEAEWLVAEMKKAAGITMHAGAASAP